jgi:hypothetical protein
MSTENASQVTVDQDVFEAVQRHAIPLVDDFNSALRRLLGLDGEGDTGAPAPKPRPPSPGRSARGAGIGTRAAPGSILPEGDYWVPILRALDEMGGSGAAADVTDRVGQFLAEELRDRDHEYNATGEIRWRNRTAFARNSMKDRGLLSRTSPRGVWEMTDEGREYFNAHR